jgi:hypothetical protein
VHDFSKLTSTFLEKEYSTEENKKFLAEFMLIPVFLSNCSPNEMTGIAEAKNIYVVGAKILKITLIYMKPIIILKFIHKGGLKCKECICQLLQTMHDKILCDH